MDNNEIQRFWLRDMEFVLYADHIKITEEKDAEIKRLRDALEPFAENPEILDKAMCHSNLTTKYRCGRCSKAIRAWEVLAKSKKETT